jgi:NAD(P)-dependent dehydrogenase (short-subunit alcohol dehydrogenase family)
MPTALITGASRGFGHATARTLGRQGWDLVVDARDGATLFASIDELGHLDGEVRAIPGDVTSARHRAELAEAVAQRGRLDLLLNNASDLGPSPLVPLVELSTVTFSEVFAVNTIAPLGLVQLLLPHLRAAGGAIVDVSSDAAVEPYPGWGGYGASKAALDHLTAVLAVELPDLDVYAFDPGDMRTDMHQAAYPQEDISDRPAPDNVVPALLRLLEERPASGRYRATELLTATRSPA